MPHAGHDHTATDDYTATDHHNDYGAWLCRWSAPRRQNRRLPHPSRPVNVQHHLSDDQRRQPQHRNNPCVPTDRPFGRHMPCRRTRHARPHLLATGQPALAFRCVAVRQPRLRHPHPASMLQHRPDRISSNRHVCVLRVFVASRRPPPGRDDGQATRRRDLFPMLQRQCRNANPSTPASATPPTAMFPHL